MKSGNLNFLETSGPLQACNGTALPYAHKAKALDSSSEPNFLLKQSGNITHENCSFLHNKNSTSELSILKLLYK